MKRRKKQSDNTAILTRLSIYCQGILSCCGYGARKVGQFLIARHCLLLAVFLQLITTLRPTQEFSTHLGTHGVHGRYWIQGSGFLCGHNPAGIQDRKQQRVKSVGVSDHGIMIMGRSTSDSEARTRQKTDQAERAGNGDPSIENKTHAPVRHVQSTRGDPESLVLATSPPHLLQLQGTWRTGGKLTCMVRQVTAARFLL